jgi:hypothetical protein
MRHSFNIDADHYQFYLEDPAAQPAYDQLWWPQSLDDRVAVQPGIIAVSTARYGTAIPLIIEVSDTAPAGEWFEAWDHVVECSIAVTSGRLQLSNPNSYGTGVPTFSLARGIYQARIYYANQDSIRGGDDLDGDDHYHIVMWPGGPTAPHVLKRMPPPAA